jgi:hypothetical protein
MIALSQSTAPAADVGHMGVLTMRGLNMRCCLVTLGFVAAAGLATPAAAQSAPSDPDTLISASLSADTGMTLARSQIADRDLLGALGTIERVLFAHPEAVPPRLLYASLLCRLDDREGAEVELGLFEGWALPDAEWQEVAASCPGIARPTPPKGRRR